MYTYLRHHIHINQQYNMNGHECKMQEIFSVMQFICENTSVLLYDVTVQWKPFLTTAVALATALQITVFSCT